MTSGGNCTSGFAINAPYRPFMVTAKHCFVGVPLGTTVRNGTNTNTNNFGWLAINGPTGVDVSLMGGSIYMGRTYRSANTTSWGNVSGSGDPTSGYTYCQYGVVSRLICGGQVTAYNAQITYPGSGEVYSVTQFERPCADGVLVRQGDSGGPVGLPLLNGTIGARGMVSAESTIGATCYGYHTPWSVIAANFGATVING